VTEKPNSLELGTNVKSILHNKALRGGLATALARFRQPVSATLEFNARNRAKNRKGRLVILSGPLCVGKSPLAKALAKFYPGGGVACIRLLAAI
jgi:hypothetical protein